MYFLMKGLPFIYQGQEIGMENLGVVSIDKVDDISALDQYQVCLDAGLTPEEALKVISIYSRDNARTPVQWNSDKNAGFTDGTPWLMVNPNYTAINVAAQEKDPDSILSFYKELIALRKILLTKKPWYMAMWFHIWKSSTILWHTTEKGRKISW